MGWGEYPFQLVLLVSCQVQTILRPALPPHTNSMILSKFVNHSFLNCKMETKIITSSSLCWRIIWVTYLELCLPGDDGSIKILSKHSYPLPLLLLSFTFIITDNNSHPIPIALWWRSRIPLRQLWITEFTVLPAIWSQTGPHSYPSLTPERGQHSEHYTTQRSKPIA